MAWYEVTVTETLRRTVTVSADSELEASDKVQAMYDEEEIVLSADDFEEVIFSDAAPAVAPVMDVLLVEPGRYPRMVTMENNLQAMQDAVDGPIEVVTLPDAVIVCNEEGKQRGLPPNRPLMDNNRRIRDVLMGTFFVCGAQDEQLTSLSEDLQKKYAAQFGKPKAFVRTQHGVMIVPLQEEAVTRPSLYTQLHEQAGKRGDSPPLPDPKKNVSER